MDDQGNVLVEQPRNLNPSENGDFGVWQMLVELQSMPAGTHLRINALTTSKVDGTTLATDSVDIIVGAPFAARRRKLIIYRTPADQKHVSFPLSTSLRLGGEGSKRVLVAE